ncbi:hypothetical protein BFP97_12585 [Roseivirga sp. 4D4]|uniref:GIN domain-containing protein n=1 Tax=Roseivirga sp. 4D4 TaxID=1889784 RepID=UPI0008539628|nr:DUF2807 domain-containing protein [Roseivirga sp. 4D4]OEK02302.1 hypothetical protein BFP97_12585 [Roseivirga sp. 4D4]
MKNFKSYLTLLLLAITCQLSNAQIKGNGQFEMRAFDMKDIKTIVFNVTVDAEIDLSIQDELFVRVDGNLFDHMIIKKKGNTLRIDQKDWIQPQANIKVIFGAQGLQKLKNTAWGNIKLINVDQEAFEAQMNVGSLQMEGKVKNLTVSTNAGKVDLSKLQVEKADASIEANGRIILNANQIEYNGDGFGQLVYLGSPELKGKSSDQDFNITTYDNYQKQALVEVEYVEVKIKNNTGRKRNIRLLGPIESPFGYGAPIRAKAVKNETLPVGTRIYQENPIGKDKLLLTITKDNAGETLKLFKQ